LIDLRLLPRLPLRPRESLTFISILISGLSDAYPTDLRPYLFLFARLLFFFLKFYHILFALATVKRVFRAKIL